jgi:hypothetical protein
MRRLRWLVFITVVAFIAASVVVNVCNAPHSFVAQGIAALPPVAAFAAIELMSRIPATHWLIAVGRVLGALVVGSVAMWLSFNHQRSYLQHIGYDHSSAGAFPVLVDGLMLVATLSLVEVVRALRTLEAAAEMPALRTATVTAPTRAPAKRTPAKKASKPRRPYGGRSGPNNDEYTDRQERRIAAQARDALQQAALDEAGV